MRVVDFLSALSRGSGTWKGSSMAAISTQALGLSAPFRVINVDLTLVEQPRAP